MDSKRSFLEKLVASGLDYGTISTDDVLRYAEPAVLAEFLPVPLKARLLEACLAAEVMDTELVVQTLGVDELAEHLPMHVLWACVAQCAGRALGDTAASDGRDSKGASASSDASKTASKGGGAKPAPESEKKSNGVTEPAPGKGPTRPPTAPPKPNVKAKPSRPNKPEGTPDKKPGIPPIGRPSAVASAKKRPVTAGRGFPGRSPTAPVIPSNEFDIDTDVGDDDWGVDDIVEVVEEAAVVGAEPLDDTRLNEGLSDWKTDEETVTRGDGNG